MDRKRQPVLRLTKKDFIIDWYSGTGAGGQHKNKHPNCCRIRHEPSGAMATGQNHRDRPANQRDAFKRICETKELQTWLKVQTLKAMGKETSIEDAVERQLKEAIIEVKDENGNWKPE